MGNRTDYSTLRRLVTTNMVSEVFINSEPALVSGLGAMAQPGRVRGRV